MGTERDDNVFSPTDLNLLNWSSVEFQIFLPHQKTSHCRLLTWIQEELHMQLTKHTSMVVYMFLHFINLKFLRYKINTKESWKKKCCNENYLTTCYTTLSPKKTMTIIITKKNSIQLFLYKQHILKYHFNVGHEIGYFWVPKTLTFKMRLGAQPFLWKWVLFAPEWKMISISKAEHLPSFWNWSQGELGNGPLITWSEKRCVQALK